MEFAHVSVLLKETVEGLNVRENGIYLDGTVGGGGHSYAIALGLRTGRLIAIDQDPEALDAAKKRLAEFPFVTFHHCNFSEWKSVLTEEGVTQLDGILLDLGVSSHQFDDPDRGFSYRFDSPLDMRMNPENPLTAERIVNTASESEIYHILRDYAEEPFAKNIAKHIVLRRQEKPIHTTGELVEIIKAAIPAKIRSHGGHPAKRTFQGLRIAVNRELDVLKDSLDEMIDALAPGGRIAVLTFHSLEDRIVKEVFRTAENPCVCPPDFPVCLCGRKSRGQVITRKPIVASPEEQEKNPRSTCAHLRIFEKG